MELNALLFWGHFVKIVASAPISSIANNRRTVILVGCLSFLLSVVEAKLLFPLNRLREPCSKTQGNGPLNPIYLKHRDLKIEGKTVDCANVVPLF